MPNKIITYIHKQTKMILNIKIGRTKPLWQKNLYKAIPKTLSHSYENFLYHSKDQHYRSNKTINLHQCFRILKNANFCSLPFF